MIKNKVLFNKPTTVGKEIRNINELNYFLVMENIQKDVQLVKEKFKMQRCIIINLAPQLLKCVQF